MKTTLNSRLFVIVFTLVALLSIFSAHSNAEVMNYYCNVPPFVSRSVPPLVLLTTGRDHKLYYEAFNEAMDLDEDGRVDIVYMHNIDYYGYFDSYKCYTYDNGTGLFSPATTSADKFCVANQWSGNVLNYLTMSRMDVLRRVLYGGHRSTDTTSSTILERVYIPGDSHSWSKEMTGRLCKKTTGATYKNMCYNDDNCDSGFECVDKSQNLIGMAASDTTVCPATAVTWSSTTNGKLLAARFSHQSGIADHNGTTHLNLLGTFYNDSLGTPVSPLSLVDLAASGNPASTSSKVKYINSFDDALLNPDNSQDTNTSTIVVGSFKTPNNNDSIGIWQFAVDGDDGVEFELANTKNGAGNIITTYYGAHAACFSPGASQSPNNKALCNVTQASNDNPNLYSAPVCSGDTSKACRMSDDMLLDLTGTCSGLGYGSCVVAPSKAYVCSAATSQGCDPATGNYLPASGTKSCANQSKGVCVRNLRETTLGKNATYYFYARQASGTGLGGMRLWYKKPKDTTWKIFDSTELTFTSPTIASGNECSIRFQSFVDTATTTTGANRRHLFCSTTRSLDGPPLLRMLHNRDQRMWNWASKERPVCADVIRKLDDTGDITLTVDTSKTDSVPANNKIWDYTVRNEVCKTIAPDNRPLANQDAAASGRETNCRAYKNTASGVITYKPAGLLQKYGEGKGGKVCSRSFTKLCSSNADCTTAEGLCIDEAPMYFGLITDSYIKNLSGGMLRKDIWSLTDEINMSTGQFYLPASSSEADYLAKYPQGSIINTFENFKTVGFSYGDNAYSDNSGANAGGSCGWIVNRPLGEGKCRMWGNPIAELMYEGLRYLAGKSDPTTAFINSATTQDGGLPLFRQPWGVNTFRPYGDENNNKAIFPICSSPFMLVLSDENVSYDSDSVPGSKFETFAGDLAGLNVATETDVIGSDAGEGFKDKTVFIGENEITQDFICSPKTVSQLSLIRGLCPEEPTKQGSFYSAGIAYYGKTKFTLNTQQVDGSGKVTVKGKPNVTTYSLVMSSPVPKITIPVDKKNVTIVPVAKSFSGGGVENSCSSKCTTSSIDAKGSLVISGCSTTATASTDGSFCPSNQIVDFYVDTILYDNNNAPPYTALNPAPNITYAKFRINFEDVEQGADHDMDAIATYEICTGSTCSPAIAAGKIKVSVSSDYSAGGIDQVMGFVVSGTTEDGTYLVVKDDGVGAGAAVIGGMPLNWDYEFTASTTATTATLLKSPLWYAAKWGSFRDGNKNNLPDIRGEWAQNCTASNIADCNPDNFYLVVNPLKLEQQLDKALNDILRQTSSGTAASIVNNSGEAGTNMLQAVFYPQKEFGDTAISWIGEMQNMWFYLDPYLNSNSIREDTVADKILDMQEDYITTITFDSSTGKTMADRFSNKGVFIDKIELDNLSPLWRAGELLYLRNLASSPRILKTSINGTSLINFTDTSDNIVDESDTIVATLKPYLQAATNAEAAKIINWVSGTDTLTDATLRSRTVTFKGNPAAPWRLGDIISSTPKMQPSSPMQGYDLDFNDLTYKDFWSSNNYKNRGMVYVGANDGMLHAFKLGNIEKIADTTHPTRVAQLTPNTSPPLGKEEWAYIPKNVLPYLKYLTQPDYSHLYTVDTTTRLIDVSINAPTGCSDDYWDCLRTTTFDKDNVDPDHQKDLKFNDTSWRTVLIGGMGLGGASRTSNGVCAVASDCVKAPITSPTGYEDHGLSSYFALDVTEPTSPSLMWEFTNPALGYTLTPPAVVRINGKVGGAGTNQNDPDTSKNGRWFTVFGSGPTGPINTTTHQFYGRSDQTLKLFIVDLKTGALLRTIDTGIEKAFAGLLTANSSLDTDFWDAKAKGFYSHDVVYIGYTYYDTTNSRWDGGVIRLITKENTDPAQWAWSKVIEGVGPITTSVASLQNRAKKELWLYLGAGRYFYKDATGFDDADPDPNDADARRYIYGIKDPCYPTGSGITAKNVFNAGCTASVMSTSSLTDQSDNPSATIGSTGWMIKLSKTNSDFKSERLLTNPTASYNGNVTFTTFMPSADICSYGGQTFVWVVKGMSGAAPAASSLKGKLILQLSTGAFETVDLKNALTGRQGRRTGTGDTSNDTPSGGYIGGTSKDSPPEQVPPKGVPRILQIRER